MTAEIFKQGAGSLAVDSDQIAIREPPKFQNPFTRNEVAILAIILVAFVALAFLPEVKGTQPLVDFFIRQQRTLFAAIGFMLAIGFFGMAYSNGRLEAARHMTSGMPLHSVFLHPVMRPISALILLALLVFLLLSLLRPIPPDSWLDLPAPLTDKANNDKLILFIHGWNGDAATTWRDFPNLAAGDSRLAGYNVWSIDYPTFMLRRNLSVTGVADFLTRHFNNTSQVFERYQEIVVVAHSMGGLVAREVAIQTVLHGRTRSFSKLIEISVPHEGANPARLGSALRISRPLTSDMAPGSDFLRDLQTHWFALAAKPHTYCISSPQDDVVSEASAKAQCADATGYPQGGHTEIVKPQSRSDLRYTTPMSQIP